MNCSTVRMKSNKPRADRDLYETPISLIMQACKRLNEDEKLFLCLGERLVLDAGCGRGVWGFIGVSLFHNGKSFGIDIKEDEEQNQFLDNFILQDYLNWNPNNKFDLILGNPPFSNAEEFVHHSFDLLEDSGYIYFFLRLAFLEGRKRQLSLFEKYPPKRVYVLTRRPSFFSTKKGKDTTDTLAYAMFLWKKGFEGKTELDWLYWENMKNE